jgi:hypothetical protein
MLGTRVDHPNASKMIRNVPDDALAESLEAPPVTMDARLARAPDHNAAVEPLVPSRSKPTFC